MQKGCVMPSAHANWGSISHRHSLGQKQCSVDPVSPEKNSDHRLVTKEDVRRSCYMLPMRWLYLLTCIFLAFATVQGVADHSSSRHQFESPVSVGQVDPSLGCAAGSSHGLCHWNVTASEAAIVSRPTVGQASFAIVLVRATGKVYPPTPRPPRPLI